MMRGVLITFARVATAKYHCWSNSWGTPIAQVKSHNLAGANDHQTSDNKSVWAGRKREETSAETSWQTA